MERREGGTEGRKEGSDEAGWKKQEDCSLMEEGRGEEGSETGAAWDGRSGDKLSDTVEFATESGFECAYGGGGVLLLDGERREEKRDDREEGREGGRRRTTEGSVRSSPVDVRGSIYKQKEEEDGGVRSGSGEEERSRRSRRRVATRLAAIARSLGGGKCWKDQKMRAPAPKTTVTQTIEGARKENRWMGKEQRRS